MWQEFARQCAEELLPVAVTILVGVLSTLGTVAVYYIKKWWGIRIAASQQDEIRLLAIEAINYVEEQARKALIAKDATPDSDTKAEMAVKYIVNQAKSQGLPELARDRLVELIESTLMGTRSEGDRP